MSSPIPWTTGGAAGATKSIAFPPDLSSWVAPEDLLGLVKAAAARACGDSWLNLLSDHGEAAAPNELLVVTAYCYLQGLFHSFDVVRRLETDELLSEVRGRLGVRPAQVRRFRREHRRSLTDCLTHALVALWRARNPSESGPGFNDSLVHNRMNFSFLEPFYLQAQDRVDRAVVLDSMALDY